MKLSGKRITVTGATGFLGRHLCRTLADRGAIVTALGSDRYDLTKPSHALMAVKQHNPEILIHAAARVGGILENERHPYAFGRDNLLMGIHALDAAIACGVEKFVLISTTCAYPSHCPVPFKEYSLWLGRAEETNSSYGHAKRLLGDMVAAAVEEGRLKCGTTCILANLFGPGDNFPPEKSHVLPALIRRFCDAVDRGLTEVECWGSGNSTRDFLYVTDAAEGIPRVCEDWYVEYPINLGTGLEVSIKMVAKLIAEIVGFKGDIKWNKNGLDGQNRRALDTHQAWDALKWEAS